MEQKEEEESPPKPQLPESFLNFLKDNKLDSSIYTSTESTPRYIRLKPGCEDITQDIDCKLDKVDWLPGFYSLPPDTRIANSKPYKEGKIYGIDAASGAAVLALDVSPGDHVLDLCAAPGAKLCMILDLLGDSGSVTGVDIASHRLAACRTLLQKYDLGDRCRLFVADGTTFSLIPPRVCSGETMLEEKVDAFREWTSRRTYKERKRALKSKGSIGSLSVFELQPEFLFYGQYSGVVGSSRSELYRSVTDTDFLTCGYDKVLVDAECTHDGSIRHIQKFESWGWQTFQRRVLDAERTDNLTCLQLKLLTNGFRVLKVGGSLVYSTCSLTVAQNERVVEQFLEENTSAGKIHLCSVLKPEKILTIDIEARIQITHRVICPRAIAYYLKLQEIDAAKAWPCGNGRLAKTLRFDPSTSQTSGLFVAKFTKSAL